MLNGNPRFLIVLLVAVSLVCREAFKAYLLPWMRVRLYEPGAKMQQMLYSTRNADDAGLKQV